MKKRIITLTLLLMLTLNGCSTEKVVTVNVHNNTDTHVTNNNILGVSALKKIGNGLWYDTTTGVVYWWNGRLVNVYKDIDAPPTPYYSPNGLLYRYIPETNTLEEIKIGE